jgi:hypothetical protein
MKIYEQYLVAYCSMPEGIEAMTIRPDITHQRLTSISMQKNLA